MEFLKIIAYIGLIGLLLTVVLLCFVDFYRNHGKAKERDIIIVRKRKTKRDFLKDPKTTMNYNGSSTYEFKNTTVDFRYIGKKHVHTYFCEEHMLKKFSEGHTYRVLLRYPDILGIVKKGIQNDGTGRVKD